MAPTKISRSPGPVRNYNLRFGRGRQAVSDDAAAAVRSASPANSDFSDAGMGSVSVTTIGCDLHAIAQYCQGVNPVVDALVDTINERLGANGVAFQVRNADLAPFKQSIYTLMTAMYDEHLKAQGLSHFEINQHIREKDDLKESADLEKSRCEAAKTELAAYKKVSEETFEQFKIQFKAVEDARAHLQIQLDALQKTHGHDLEEIKKLAQQVATLKAQKESAEQFHDHLLDKIAAMGKRELISMQTLEEFQTDGFCRVQSSTFDVGDIMEAAFSPPQTPK